MEMLGRLDHLDDEDSGDCPDSPLKGCQLRMDEKAGTCGTGALSGLSEVAGVGRMRRNALRALLKELGSGWALASWKAVGLRDRTASAGISSMSEYMPEPDSSEDDEEVRP